MATLNPYLNFNGNAEEAFNFYKSVFGGEFTALQRFGDIPASVCDGKQVSETDREKIMHVALPIGRETTLMATDALESMEQKINVGNNFHISINAESREEADKIFGGLAVGGAVKMPLADAFWNAYFGMLTDRFGVAWMINYDYSASKQ